MHVQLAFGLTALSVALFAAPAPAADDANAIVAKAIEASGGKDLLNKYMAGRMNLKGTLKVMDMDLEFTGKSSYQIPGKERTTINLDAGGVKVNVVQVVDGKQARVTVNGEEHQLTDAQKQDLLQSTQLTTMYQLTPLLDTKKYDVKVISDSPKVDGKETVGLSVSSKGFKEVKLYFDKKSGLLVRADREALDEGENKVQETTYLKDYKKVQGVQTPMKLEVHHDGKKYMEAEVSSVELLEKADPKEFDLSR